MGHPFLKPEDKIWRESNKDKKLYNKTLKGLRKNDITLRRITKAKKKLLILCKKEFPKTTSKERTQINILKNCYRKEDEKNLTLAGEIFTLHNKLLKSSNPAILEEAINQAEIIAKRYTMALEEEYNSIFIKK